MMNDQLWERVLYCFIKIRSVKVTYIGCFLLDLDCLILYHTIDSGYKLLTIDLTCMLLTWIQKKVWSFIKISKLYDKHSLLISHFIASISFSMKDTFILVKLLIWVFLPHQKITYIQSRLYNRGRSRPENHNKTWTIEYGRANILGNAIGCLS